MITHLTGSCFCRSLQYEITQPLVVARCCHCSRCRKVFSGASSAYAEIEPGSFRWTSRISALKLFASQDEYEIAFCSDCGSTIAGLYKGEVHGVTLGTLDGDPGVEVSMHIHVASKAPWDCIGGNAPQYAEQYSE